MNPIAQCQEWLKQGAEKTRLGQDGAGWIGPEDEVPDLEFGQGIVVHTSVYPPKNKAKL